MKVTRLEGRLAVELPADVVTALDLREGDEVDMQLTRHENGAPPGKMARADALERLKQFRGLLPPDYRFDREEANAR